MLLMQQFGFSATKLNAISFKVTTYIAILCVKYTNTNYVQLKLAVAAYIIMKDVNSYCIGNQYKTLYEESEWDDIGLAWYQHT